MRAAGAAEAASSAERFGRAEDDEYLNSDGERVRWEFEMVIDLREIGSRMTSGRELYSFFVSPDVLQEIQSAVGARLVTLPGADGVGAQRTPHDPRQLTRMDDSTDRKRPLGAEPTRRSEKGKATGRS